MSEQQCDQWRSKWKKSTRITMEYMRVCQYICLIMELEMELELQLPEAMAMAMAIQVAVNVHVTNVVKRIPHEDH